MVWRWRVGLETATLLARERMVPWFQRVWAGWEV